MIREMKIVWKWKYKSISNENKGHLHDQDVVNFDLVPLISLFCLIKSLFARGLVNTRSFLSESLWG